MELNMITSEGKNVYIRNDRGTIKFFQLKDNKVVTDCRISAYTLLHDLLHSHETVIRHNNQWDDSIIVTFTEKETEYVIEKLGLKQEWGEMVSEHTLS